MLDQSMRDEAALLREIEALAATLAAARAEIAAIGAGDIAAGHIPTATGELDAIAEHTASATDNILSCCEAMEAVMARLPAGDAHQLLGSITRIYEACSFQDITGQRITKIVTVLHAIERRVAHMIAVLEPGPALRAEPPATLLHGPQSPALAMNQSGIDAILASFD